MNNLKGKTAFITGAASGIGRATAARFIAEGARVFTIDINGESLTAMEDEFGKGQFGYLAGSVTDEVLVDKAFAACAGKFGNVDILVNNAGLGIPTPDLSTTDLDVYRKMIDVNITGVFLASRAALRQMKPRGKGHIITLVSMAGQRTNPGAPIYCASKFGARGLSSGLADQIIKAGIKVSDINPGPVNSNYWGDRDVPRDKFLSVEDVAEIILFTASAPEHVVIREINFDNMKWLAK
jgi:NADP-dependent 3-hydroxy acid dehydrogenase YdfG